MQIKMKLNKNFYIENSKITGIICDDINYLYKINEMILLGDDAFEYSPKSRKNSIGLISLKETYDVSNKVVKDYLSNKNISETFKMLGLNESILDRKVSSLSTSEKILIIFAKVLLKNPDTILVDNILSKLDFKLRDKIIKLLLKLRKFEKKTIVVSSTDVDIIFELIDNIIIIKDAEVISSIDKYDTYKDNKIIDKPLVVEITDRVYNKSSIKLGNNDSVNELIKAIYREIR